MVKVLKQIKLRIREMPVMVRASAAFMICTFMQRGISVLTTPIFTRILTTEQFGYYSIFTSWLDVVSVFTTLKLAGGVFTQALVKFEEKRDELIASTAGLGTTITIAVTLLYLIFRDIVNSLVGMDTFIIICMIVSAWATLMFDMWAAHQRVEYKYKGLIILTLVVSVAKPLTGVLAILQTQNYKAEARIISLVAVEVLCFSWLFLLFIKRGRTFYNKRFWRYSLSLNVPLIPHYLTRTVLNQCDRLMIKAMLGYSEAGIYSLAYNLAMLLTLVNSSILNSFNPWMYQRIKTGEYKKIAPVSYVLLGVIAMAALGLTAIAPEIVRAFAPIEYYEAIWVIPPVTVGMYFLFMYSLYANFEFYFERTRLMTFVSTLGGALNVILNYLCIPIWGYVAAGYTTLFCYMLYAVAHYFGMKKIVKDKLSNIEIYNMRIIIAISAGLICLSVVMMSFYENILVRYCILLILLSGGFLKRKKIIQVFNEL